MRLPDNPRYQQIMKYFALAMALAYAMLGFAILFSVGDLAMVPQAYSLPLGLIMIAYAAFRGYRFVQQYVRKNREEGHEQ